MMGGRARRSLLDHLPVPFRKLTLGGHVDLDRLERLIPVRGILGPRDRPRVHVDAGLHLQTLEIDPRPRAVQRDGLGHARGEGDESCLDRLDAVVGPLHAERVAHLLPGPELNGEVPGGFTHLLFPELPGPHSAEVPEAAALPDRPGLQAESETLRRRLVLLVERLDLAGVDARYRHLLPPPSLSVAVAVISRIAGTRAGPSPPGGCGRGQVPAATWRAYSGGLGGEGTTRI